MKRNRTRHAKKKFNTQTYLTHRPSYRHRCTNNKGTVYSRHHFLKSSRCFRLLGLMSKSCISRTHEVLREAQREQTFEVVLMLPNNALADVAIFLLPDVLKDAKFNPDLEVEERTLAPKSEDFDVTVDGGPTKTKIRGRETNS